MRLAIFLLLLMSISLASSGLFTEPPQEPGEAITTQIQVILGLMAPLIITMVFLAAAVYVIGRMFGAEARARATVWSHGMLTAAGISAVIIVLLYVLLPGFMDPASMSLSLSIANMVADLASIARTALMALILICVILAAVVFALGQVADAQTRAKASGWASGLVGAAVLGAIIYVVFFGIFEQFALTFFSGPNLAAYSVIIVGIVAFTFAFILITFLFSRIFKVPEWEAYLNLELSNLVNSFLLMLFVLGLFAVGDAVALTVTEGLGDTPPLAAVEYMRSTVANSVLTAIYDVYQIQACTSMLNTITRRIGEFVLTQTYKVFPGIDTFVSITNVIGFGLVSVYGSISAQITLLYFIDSTMRYLFLPAGLVLRFFPPTRDAGAFLISLAFGLQIIFPTAYIINKTIFEEIGGTIYQSRYALIASLCGPFKYGLAGILINPGTNPVFGLIPGGAAIGTLLMRLVSESLLNAVSMAEFIPILRHIGSLSLLALFIPALAMMITMAFINAMTKFIVAKV